MKINFTTLLLFTCFGSFSQTVTDKDRQANIQTYYRLALQCKDGAGVAVDYTKAYSYFEKAADLGDAQSIYALGYMHYKGLGTSQDYNKAFSYFKQGALQGRDNSMYFYALCWRNGYGTYQNEDSAAYWLKKAEAQGYQQAAMELKMKAAENSDDAAKALVQQIHNAALPDGATVNRFQKMSNNLSSAEVIEGRYSGYLIQYDWSGQNVVSSKKLALTLTRSGGGIKGYWKEEGAEDSVNLTASLKGAVLAFDNTQYRRKDHYSPDNGVLYTFKDAGLNLVQQEGTAFLAGNVTMFSPERKEPSKPLLVALSRSDVASKDPVAMSLRANPNPFTDVLQVDFQLPQAAQVEIQLLTASGAIAYRNNAGLLQPGRYLLPLRPGLSAPGGYVLKLVYGQQSSVVKIVKW